MKEECGYLSDKELEALISNVEDNAMIAPPVYLKEQIMGEIKRENQLRKEKTAKIRFLFYSAKIIGAAAAAIFCLTVMPMETDRVMAAKRSDSMEKQIEKDVERYKAEKRRLLEEPDEKNGGLERIINGVSKWFEMEEENYG